MNILVEKMLIWITEAQVELIKHTNGLKSYKPGLFSHVYGVTLHITESPKLYNK